MHAYCMMTKGGERERERERGKEREALAQVQFMMMYPKLNLRGCML